MSLETELARRAKRGHKPTTLADIKTRLAALGYRLKRSMDARSVCWIIKGEGAGDTYPTVVLYPIEADTGRSAFHYQSRRDANFKELQRLRYEGELFAVVRGYLVEP